MYQGFININKPSGISSNYVLKQIKPHLEGSKIGFVGTLDPLASGVLPVCLGFATRLSDMISDQIKEYIFTGIFGSQTDSHDSEGKIIARSEFNHVKKEDLINLLNKLKVFYNQEAPIFSALKVNGKKMYELAREGIKVKPRVRNVKLLNFEIIDFEKPSFRIKILCSKGFYVRSLARDIGIYLGTHAHLTSLVRTKSSGFDISDSFSMDQINEHLKNGGIKKLITPIDELLTEIKTVYLNEIEAKKILNGNVLKKNIKGIINNEKLIIYDEKLSIISVGDYKDGSIFPVKVVAHG